MAEKSESSLNVRPATVKDFPRLMVLMFEYLTEFEGKTDLPEDAKDSVRQSVWRALQTGSVIFLIAEKTKYGKQYAVGYGAFDLREDIFDNLIGWGHQLYVEPPYRVQRVADEIVKKAEFMAANAGAKEFYIDTKIPKFFKKKFGYEDLYRVVVKKLEGSKNVE
jgi:GNAT superfamily N-acetyltransferase